MKTRENKWIFKVEWMYIYIIWWKRKQARKWIAWWFKKSSSWGWSRSTWLAQSIGRTYKPIPGHELEPDVGPRAYLIKITKRKKKIIITKRSSEEVTYEVSSIKPVLNVIIDIKYLKIITFYLPRLYNHTPFTSLRNYENKRSFTWKSTLSSVSQDRLTGHCQMA